jgi:hypothetical protein
MTRKIIVTKIINEVYEMSDEKYDELFEFDDCGHIDCDKWTDHEIAMEFEDHGKLVSKDWQYSEDPINSID